jgi:transposase
VIARETQAEIVRLYHAEKWKVGTIATQLGVHHTTVRRVLAQAGIDQTQLTIRSSIADPFVPFIVKTLEQYPKLCASRLYQMVKERGYPGGPDHFRAIVARYRPRPPAEAYLRLRTLPGEQAQVDWAHFGKLTVGQAERPLMAFVMVASYSRHLFLRFYLGQSMPYFLRGHVEAFQWFSAVPRVLLYDNLKSAVLERRGTAIRFHPTLLELAAHYRFEPRPVAVARGNEKGRVERAIQFVRSSFFAARSWSDLEDLNAQAAVWAATEAAARKCPGDRARTVAEVFEEDQPKMLALPDNPFPTDEIVDVRVGKTPYVRFDRNDYSVPHTSVRRALVVAATLKTVRVLEGNEVIATHARSFDRAAQIEDPAHIEALVAHKHAAREHRGIDRLHHAVPASRQLFEHIARRGGNLGATTSALLKLLDRYGAADLTRAITEAMVAGRTHVGAVRQLLDQRQSAKGKPPPITAPVASDPRVRDIVVTPHNLGSYDEISGEEEEEEEDDDNDET